MLARTVRTVVVLLLVLGWGIAGTAGPANAAYSDPLTAISPAPADLNWHATSSAAISGLDDALPNVGVGTVVGDTNHPMRSCGSAEKAALPAAPTATTSWCWDSAGDATTETWSPQGVTTSGDADDDGKWGDHTVLLSGWAYAASGGRYDDMRVAFVNYDDPSQPRYRWVYLVAPNSSGTDFSAAKGHVGGMIWYGDKLMVVAVGNTSTAIRVFSMSHILQATDASSTIGKTSGGYAAYGYRYVMPQIGSYTYAGGTCSMSSDTGTPCFSSMSLDRSTSPDSLVTTEYFRDASLYGRLFRFSFGSDFLLATSGGTASATQGYRSHVGNMQGVLSWGGRWWVAHSSATRAGQLWAQTTSSGASKTCTNDWGSPNMCWGIHPEGMTYDYATGQVWSQTEWSSTTCADQSQTCGRTLFAVPRTAFP